MAQSNCCPPYPPYPPAPQSLVEFWCNTKNSYLCLPVKNPKTIYFCYDTGEIFKGEDPYSHAVKVVTDLPTYSIKTDILYVILNGEKAGGYSFISLTSSWVKVLDKAALTGDVSDSNVIFYMADGTIQRNPMQDVITDIHKSIDWLPI